MDWIFPYASAEVLTLLTLSVKATAIIGLALLLRQTMRKFSASMRCFVVSVSVLAAATLPALELIAPEWQIQIPSAIEVRLTTEQIGSFDQALAVGSTGSEAHSAVASNGIEESSTASHNYWDWVLYLWLLGTIVAAGRVLLGMTWSWIARHKSQPVSSPQIIEIVQLALRRIELRKPITVLVSAHTRVPYVSGLLKPVLMLPLDAEQWPKQRLMSVLLHEFAHLKRRDNITWPLMNLLASWLWFQPLTWVSLALIARDREKACDDLAVSCGDSHLNYAQHLLDVCASLKAGIRPAPTGVYFARKNDVKDRITYMLNTEKDRRSVSQRMRVSVSIIAVLVTLPLVGLSGFTTTMTLDNISPSERDAIVTVLDELYADLSEGTDYQTVRERFLTRDYFKNPELTLETVDKAVWRPVFDNTISLITEEGVGIAREVRTRVNSITRDGDEAVVTLQLDIVADRVRGDIEHIGDGATVIRRSSSSKGEDGIEECHLVDAVSQQVRLKQEDGQWKVSQFDDSITLMRMDTDSPHGPIFLVWMDGLDATSTPFGPGVFKVIPRDIVPDASNTRFVLEE